MHLPVNNWNELDLSVRGAEYLLFQKNILGFNKPMRHSTYRIHDPTGIKPLNGSQVSLRHLKEHKLTHNFADTLNSLSACAVETKCNEQLFSNQT